jgi:hypothetical protein
VTELGRVGGARAAGVRYTMATADRDIAAMWIANTDADPWCRSIGCRPSIVMLAAREANRSNSAAGSTSAGPPMSMSPSSSSPPGADTLGDATAH